VNDKGRYRYTSRDHDFARPLAASHATGIPNRSLTTLSRF
jgi:hypothetical protein